jgi:tetratricopeptide (TPR) repeat protein
MDPFETQFEEQDSRGTLLGRYRLLRVLGKGGMGIVYEAEPIDGGNRVALKTMLKSNVMFAQLKDEFRKIHDLAHPNLVQLGELVTTERVPFFTMELVHGRPWDEYVRTTRDSAAVGSTLPFHEDRIRSSLKQLAEGLAAMHANGLVHRDIKPSNVMVTHEGRVVILDMGLAIGQKAESISPGPVAGTPYYMAPEQVLGMDASPACDWYAVGVMLYEGLTGDSLFQSRTLDRLFEEKKRLDLRHPSDMVAGVPKDLGDLAVGMLHAHPNHRLGDSEILRVLSSPAAQHAMTSIWIGRERELAILRDVWKHVLDGRTEIAFIVGRSGVGKTALAEQFLGLIRRSDQAIILRGRCYENESVAYRGFDSLVDALAEYLKSLAAHEVERILPLDSEALCQLFPVLSQVPGMQSQRHRKRVVGYDAIQQRRIGIDALRELLSRLSRYVSLVLFIDDLQQGDEETAAVFRDLLFSDSAPSILFLGTYRAEDRDESVCLQRIRELEAMGTESRAVPHISELLVEPLTDDDTKLLVYRYFAEMGMDCQKACQEEVDRIACESGGDPLFVKMLAEERARQSFNEKTGNPTVAIREEAPNPTTSLLEVVASKLRSLPSREWYAMGLLAAAGRPLRSEDLESLVADSMGLVRSLRAQHLVRRLGDRNRIEPFHDKIGEATLAMLSPELRTQHCATLASYLDQTQKDKDFEFLAALYRDAGKLDLASRYFADAGEVAEASLAFYRAIDCYRNALTLCPTALEDRLGVQRRLADSLANTGRSLEAAREYLSSAAEAQEDDRAELQRRAALRFLTSGHVNEGMSVLKEALQHSRLPWPSNRWQTVAGILSRRCWLGLRGFRPAANAKATPFQEQQLQTGWAAAAGMSMVDPLLGTFYTADNLCRSLAVGSHVALHRDLAAFMGQVAIGGSRSRKATLKVLNAHRILIARSRDPYQRALPCLSRGIAALLRGDWSNALRCCEHAIRFLADPRCVGKTWELQTARTFALWALQYQGEIRELTQRQSELLRSAHDANDLYAILNFGTQVTAHVMLAKDQPEEAQVLLERDRERLSDRGFFIQHHNDVLARTATCIYADKAEQALSCIEGKYDEYHRSFLSQIQQVRIDHRQVLVRAHLAAAASGIQTKRNLDQARRFIRLLRRERAHWASSLAMAFDAAIASFQNPSEAPSQFAAASEALESCNMQLFAAAARNLRHRYSSGRSNQHDPYWKAQGIVNAERMTHMLLPTPRADMSRGR